MIKTRIIPDGLSELPKEATEHRLIAEKIKAQGVISDKSELSWRDIEITISRKELIVQIPAETSDVSQTTKDNICSAICSVANVKQHPSGWQE